MTVKLTGELVRTEVSLKDLSTLSTNPHYYAFLLQSFLTGYNKPCKVSILLMALPILLYSESREKLIRANNRSNISSLFSSPKEMNNGSLSGKTRLSGYLDRYQTLLESSKKAIVILSSKKIILITDRKIMALQTLHYYDYNDKVRDWLKAAFYLGIVFAKANEDHLCYFLGVNIHE
jgi:hypothetical protein